MAEPVQSQDDPDGTEQISDLPGSPGPLADSCGNPTNAELPEPQTPIFEGLYPVALPAVSLLGASVINVILVIGLLRWMGFARVLRGEVLKLVEMDFVRLAMAAGASKTRIMITHIFPNITNTLLVLATLELGLAVIVEASLSFLGLGVPRPMPSWGSMLKDSQLYIYLTWWFPVIPGIAITLLVMSANLTGDWLRDRLDPTRRQL